MMPMLARFRTHYEQITIPLGHLCLRLGLKPDTLTCISLVIGAFSAYLLAHRSFFLGILAILLMGFADMLDGATARAGKTANPYGTVLDHIVDRYAEFMIIFGIMLSGAVEPGWAMFTLFGMIMASYVRARAESTRLIDSCNVGFAGRQEKFAILLFGMLLEPSLSAYTPLQWAAIIVGVISHITALQRLLYTRRVIIVDHQPEQSCKNQQIL